MKLGQSWSEPTEAGRREGAGAFGDGWQEQSSRLRIVMTTTVLQVGKEAKRMIVWPCTTVLGYFDEIANQRTENHYFVAVGRSPAGAGGLSPCNMCHAELRFLFCSLQG